MTKTTITINGRVYDAVTGLPITPHQAAKPVFSDIGPKTHTAPAHVASSADTQPTRVLSPHEVHAAAQAMHRTTQKSHTLYRRALKKPDTTPATASHHQHSPMVSRFAAQHGTEKQHAPVATPKDIETPIRAAQVHPAVAHVAHHHAAVQPPAAPHLSGSELKEQLIKERLAEVSDAPSKKEKAGNWLSRQPRLVTILSSTLALLILGGYLTYITLPSISLRVAASRAGLNASMPQYKPDGYSLDGPITYSPGEVVISYKSNTNNDSGYKLTQKASNWDSQAVLDNYVTKLTDNYLTFQERGITVYTFNNKAVWVNGGLLYTIDGNATLSSDQVLRVATSL